MSGHVKMLMFRTLRLTGAEQHASARSPPEQHAEEKHARPDLWSHASRGVLIDMLIAQECHLIPQPDQLM